MMGFAWMFALFLVCAIAYKPLTQPSGIHWFQFLYFFSSFWGQFGPNATTWLLPGELFPTEARAMSHGLSAAVGKVTPFVIFPDHDCVGMCLTVTSQKLCAECNFQPLYRLAIQTLAMQLLMLKQQSNKAQTKGAQKPLVPK